MSGYLITLPDDQSGGPAPADGGGFQITLPQQQGDASDALRRGTGLSVRALAQGALALPMLPINLGIGIGNLINKGTNALGLTDAGQMPSGSELTDRALTTMGVTEPRNAAERVAVDAMSAGTGGGGVALAADKAATTALPSIERAVAERVAQAPAAQTAAGVAGGVAGGVTREAGGGPWAQLGAGMLGGFVPSAMRAGGEAAARGFLRGTNAAGYNDRLQAFTDAGIEPTADQASPTRMGQASGAILSRLPGGAGPYAEQSAAEANAAGGRIEDIASNLSPGANATKAGQTIKSGLQSYVERFKAQQAQLYNDLDAQMPPSTTVQLPNTLSALSAMNADIPGAPALSQWFKNAKIVGIERAAQSDLAATPEGVPWEAVKKLRTLVGDQLTNTSLVDDVPRSKWKALYGALSQDMQLAATQAGPEAKSAFDWANAYTAAGLNRIENVLNDVSGKGTAEKIFQAAVNPSEVREGATTINSVMRSLNPEERRVVSAATVRRLGIANPSAQDAEGNVFSMQTFLTNWNKISPEAKRTLFADPDARTGLQSLADAASMVRDGSRIFANPSGTAPLLSTQNSILSGLGLLLTGHVGGSAAVAGTTALSNGAARLMTNPDFVRWIGKTTQMPPELLPVQLGFLVRQSSKWSDEDKSALDQFIKSTGAQPR